MAYVYVHKRKDNDGIFYVGISEGENGYERAQTKRGRNPYWKRVVEKVGFRWEIVEDGITFEEAKSREIQLIKEYRDKGYGLTNMTDGGEGTLNYRMPKRERRIASDKVATKRWNTVGGLIKKLSEWDAATPVYIGMVETFESDLVPKYPYLIEQINIDTVSLTERMMVAHDCDDIDDRWPGTDLLCPKENCVVLIPLSHRDKIRKSFEAEKEGERLRNELDYNEQIDWWNRNREENEKVKSLTDEERDRMWETIDKLDDNRHRIDLIAKKSG